MGDHKWSHSWQQRSQMNKLLLVLALGLACLAFTDAGSSEEENQVESFESGLARLAREADPGNGKRKVAKNKKSRKNAQKKKKNRKNSPRSGKGKKKSEKKKNKKKSERRQKKKKDLKKEKKKKKKKKKKAKGKAAKN